MSNYKLPVTEELDFHYLLELMPALKGIERYHLLPELFSTIGIDSFLLLCKYAGGEVIQIPTVLELKESMEALQWFYDVYISKCKDECGIPPRILDSVSKIREVFDVRNSEAED